MNIYGFNKTTLLDYPGHLASTIFLGGCNYRCPFCHNSSLVLSPESQPTIAEEEVFLTLKKRKAVLEGVCITGGEPTLYEELPQFIEEIKNMGFLVKLDTNGQNPKAIKELIKHNLVDYIALDIKNSKEKYHLSTGLSNFDTSNVEESVTYLLSSKIDYEFRTTVVKEHHTLEDFKSIGQWIQGCKAYYLQAFKDSGHILSPGLSGYEKEELMLFANTVKPYVFEVGIRGID